MERDDKAFELDLIEICQYLRHDYPPQLASALSCNLKFTKTWYQYQGQSGILIPTRARLILPLSYEGLRKEKYIKA